MATASGACSFLTLEYPTPTFYPKPVRLNVIPTQDTQTGSVLTHSLTAPSCL